MGSWFSNIHIRKTENISTESFADYINDLMIARQYLPAVTEKEADGVIAVVDSGEWLCVYSDLLPLEEPHKWKEIGSHLSAALHTDVLGISCFDSDYLYLNLLNADENTDAWVGIGSASGLNIKRRTSINAWKKKVSDFEKFSESAKKAYVCAEEFLTEIACCLNLPESCSTASCEMLKDLIPDSKVRCFYFKLPDEMKNRDPVKLVPWMYSDMPCFLEKPSVVYGINIGGESKGLSVYFVGSYVEKEEITFSDVCFVKSRNGAIESIPITLTKVQLPDGQWAYHYHDPSFRIVPKVDDRLPVSKQMKLRNERSIAVRFIPHGNPRKILDITVVLVPDKNPAGQTGWNVLHLHQSKKAYIDSYNKTWSRLHDCVPALKEEDFD